ncbi:ParB/Srx family N-terminal domain-containing protein (plasmid) [Escherichia coli]
MPLASLIKSPLNVRTVPYSAESVSELAESIKGVGLVARIWSCILCLVTVTVSPAGGRRLAALNMLAERGIIPADWPVRVKVIPQELATAASMTENGHRRDMYTLLNRLPDSAQWRRKGKTPAQIGDLLGYSPRPRSANAETGLTLRLSSSMRWQKTASPPNTVRRWRWRTTPRVRCRCLKLPVSRDVGRKTGCAGYPAIWITESEVAVAGNSKFRFVRG